MQGFFSAPSVAVIGVSNAPTNLGRIMVYNLLEFRYAGTIYLVGPKGGSFLGHKIYPSVAELPDPVELATVLVPARAVPEVLRQCGGHGIRRIVLQSAGFRELGGDGLGLEREVISILNEYGMRLIGPNCIGIINRGNGLAVPFMPFKVETAPGRVGIISQSGGVGGMIINSLAAENIGFSKFASIGNKLNVNEEDLMEYLIEDAATGLIFCYLEGIAEGRRLMEVAARSDKPILVHKSNTGASGALIARSHSASLSSDDRVVDAAFAQCGIIRVREQHDAIETLKAFSLPRMQGNRLAIISRSGGHAVMAADAAEEFGFELPPVDQEVIRLVEVHSRANVIQFHNPLDLGDLFDMPLYRTLAEKTLERADIDGLVFIHNYQGIFDAEASRELIGSFKELMGRFNKPMAVCVFTVKSELDVNRRSVGYPIFTDPREALRALALSRDWKALGSSPFAATPPGGVQRAEARRALDASASGPLSPETLAAILSAYGVSLIPWEKVVSAQEAVAAAHRLGYPLVMKTAQPEVLHKTDAGGVYLGIQDEAAVRHAYERLGALGPAVLMQATAGQGPEWLIGGRQDLNFGPILIAGMGGIYVEFFKETAIRVGPIAADEASRMVGESRASALLKGVRGQARLDRRALEETLVRVSWLLYDLPQIQELDLNPVRVFPQGCSTLDWRAVKAG